MVSLCLLNIASQSSLHSWGEEIRLLVMDGYRFVSLASVDTGRLRCVILFDTMMLLLGSCAVVGCSGVSDWILSLSAKLCFVQPVSTMVSTVSCCKLLLSMRLFMLSSCWHHSGLFFWLPPMLLSHVASALWPSS